jgi:hypothetical protein
MNRSLDARLRGLEAKATARPVHIIWSDTSDRTEWDRKKADLIASGKASDGDKSSLSDGATQEARRTGGDPTSID